MSKPTERQLAFIKEMCEVLDMDNPDPKTKQDASNFISENIENYRFVVDELRCVDEMYDMLGD